VIIDVATGDDVLELSGFDTYPHRITWSPDGQWIAAAAQDEVPVWDATTGALRVVLRGHTATVNGIDWSADSVRIATGSADGTARVWELTDEGARAVMTLSASGTLNGVAGVAFAPDGRRLMTGDAANATTTIFDVDVTGTAEWINFPAPAELTGIDFFRDGKRLVASSENASAATWAWTPAACLA